MKKSIVLTILIVIINSCAVPKKEYYVFDRYTPKKAPRPEQTVQQLDAEAVLPQGIILPVLKQEEIQSLENASLPYVKSNTAKRQRTNVDAESNQQSLPSVAKQGDDFTLKPLQPEPSSIQRKSGDRILLLATALIGLSVLTAIRLMRPVTTKLTRWAKANPKKTQGLIAGIQLPLLGLGVMNGYNLDQLGYEISDTSTYLFGTIMTIGFLIAPFIRPKEEVITIPKKLIRHRLAYTAITLSSIMLATGFGNNIERMNPDSRLAKTIQVIDENVFAPDTNTDKNINNTSSAKFLQDRPAKAGISVIAAIFLSLILSITTCAGICLIIGAFGTVSAGSIVGGIVLLALSIWGFIGIGRGRGKRRAQNITEK